MAEVVELTRMSNKPRMMSVAEPAYRSPYRATASGPRSSLTLSGCTFAWPQFATFRDLLAKRGVIVSHEAIRQWCTKFGAAYASGLVRRRARPGDKRYLDEVLLKINGTSHWLWRAVDQPGVVLDIIVQQQRDQHAAEFPLAGGSIAVGYDPRVVITDRLASYPPAIQRVLPNSEHRRQASERPS